MISITPPFVLRLSKDERKVFQQNLFCRLPLLICLGGEFDLDLGAEGAGERRMNYEG